MLLGMFCVGVLSFVVAIGITVPAHAGIGWYLLTPPFENDGPRAFQLQSESPLGRWDHVRAFDSAAVCETERANESAIAVETLRKVMKEANTNEKATRVVILMLNAKMSAKCIASDDPRLR